MPASNVLDAALMGDLRRLLTALRDDDSVRVMYDAKTAERYGWVDPGRPRR
ncbi:hypothetical protein [Microbispora bryophytorum]|uniref:hypothetical protein n=1 Tax=Microbispora bryophytorum TaxID=1460882 RepID=UPI0033FB8946